MDRRKALKGKESEALFNSINALHNDLFQEFATQFSRSLPFADEVIDRWEKAKELGFGEGSSIYDSSFVFGSVKVGINTWIGPFTIIDGSGGLEIGDNCTISTGVHIYTHDNIGRTLTGGRMEIQKAAVSIGECTYIGPNVVISKGVVIGDHCVIGANAFVNKSIPPNSVAVGSPAKPIGKVIVIEDKVTFEYFK